MHGGLDTSSVFRRLFVRFCAERRRNFFRAGERQRWGARSEARHYFPFSEGVLSLSDERARKERKAAEDDVPVRKGRVYTRVTGDSKSGERRLPNHLND